MSDGAELRPLRKEDAEEVAALYQSAFGDERPMDAQEIVEWFSNAEIKEEWLRVLEIDGRVVGYGDILIEEDEMALDVVAPGHWDPFFDWAEGQARANKLARVRAYSPPGHELAGIVEGLGYRYWRSTFTMQIDLDDAVPKAEPIPPGLEIRTYVPEDAERLRAAINEAFAADPFHHDLTPDWFREFFLRGRGFDPSLWLLAWDGSELAGLVLAYPQNSGDDSLGWVSVLGVRSNWRRKGLGTALLTAVFVELHKRGLRKVGLGVDAENVTGALRVYERVGMRAIRQGDHWLLTL